MKQIHKELQKKQQPKRKRYAPCVINKAYEYRKYACYFTLTDCSLNLFKINPDGHCLFAAVADQLALLSILPLTEATYHTTRKSAADYIQSHPDDFLPFLIPLSHDNTDGLMTSEEFKKYCDMIRLSAAWGGEPEILALSKAYNVPIHVIQGGRPSEVIHRPNDSHDRHPDMVVRISYHRHMYGLGEVRRGSSMSENNHSPVYYKHYNSLRPNKIPP